VWQTCSVRTNGRASWRESAAPGTTRLNSVLSRGCEIIRFADDGEALSFRAGLILFLQNARLQCSATETFGTVIPRGSDSPRAIASIGNRRFSATRSVIERSMESLEGWGGASYDSGNHR